MGRNCATARSAARPSVIPTKRLVILQILGALRATNPGLSVALVSACLLVPFTHGSAQTPTQNLSQIKYAVPDFSGLGLSGLWTRTGSVRGSYDPPPDGGPGPIVQDPRYPWRRARGWDQLRPPAFVEEPDDIIRIVDAWVPDLSNPILLPATREYLARIAEQELADIPHMQLQTMCMAPGVPHILNLFEHMQILQMPDEIIFLHSRNNLVRHVYLNQPHGNRTAHFWWGDSVGHYEGDSLIIDTIGTNDQTNVDRFGTPHSEKMHVVERYRMSDDGEILEILITIEDPDSFTAPWSARADYRPSDRDWLETICPENAEREYWPGRPIYLPKDETPDF